MLVGVSGLGSVGQQDLAAFGQIPRIRLIALDANPACRDKAGTRPTADQVAADFDKLLDAEPDAPVIAGPNQVHAPQLPAAARRRIAVLVENPVAADLTQAGAAAADGIPALVGYVLRHRLVVQRTQQLLAEQTIGQPVTTHAALGSYHTSEAAVSAFAIAEPNRLYRDYSYQWDYLRWFSRRLPKRFRGPTRWRDTGRPLTCWPWPTGRPRRR